MNTYKSNCYLLSLLICMAVFTAPAFAQTTLTWDDSGANPTNPVDGASSSWDTISAVWSNGSSDQIWNNANNDIAVFGNNNGTADILNLVSNITVGGITFNAASSGNYTIEGVSNSGTLTLGGSAPTITTNVNATIHAVITGTAALIKTGTGTLTLSNANSYSGGTIIKNGTVSIGLIDNRNNNSALGSGGITLDGGTLLYTGGANATAPYRIAFTLGANGGTFSSSGAGAIASSVSTGNNIMKFTGTGARTLTLAGTSGGSNSPNIFSWQINDAAVGSPTSITKTGAGAWALNGANNYTGQTLISQGTLVANSNGAFGLSTVSLDLNGFLALQIGVNATVSVLQDGPNGGGKVFTDSPTGSDVGFGTITVGSGTFSGAIINNATRPNKTTALAKNTTGTLVLTGTSSNYSAGTTISSGVLLVNNTAGSGLGTGAVAVNSGTLGGKGFISLSSTNSITVATGAVIAPGANNTGILTLNGINTTGAVLHMQDGSSFNFALGAANTSTTLQFYNYLTGDFLSDNTGIGVTLNFSGATAGTFDLFKFYSDSGTTLSTLNLSSLTSNLVLGSGLSGYTATWDYSQNGILALQLSAVPEPSVYVLMVIGVSALAVLRRKRRTDSI